jgi:hypothetical protein
MFQCSQRLHAAKQENCSAEVRGSMVVGQLRRTVGVPVHFHPQWIQDPLIIWQSLIMPSLE